MFTHASALPGHVSLHFKTLRTQTKERLLKPTREKSQVTHKDRLLSITSDYLMETFKPRKAWKDVLQFLKDNHCQPKLLNYLLRSHVSNFIMYINDSQGKQKQTTPRETRWEEIIKIGAKTNEI